IRFLTKNSSVAQIEVYASVILADDDTIIGISGTLNDITERKRTEQHLRAEDATTRVLAESATLSEATPKLLQAICESLVGWDVGELWSMDASAKVLRCVETWHWQSVDVSEFEAASSQITFAPGVGLPGQIWESAEPRWIANVVEEANFLRTSIAAKVGLHAAFGFPFLSGDERLGVMSFFSRQEQPPDADLLKTMAAIGSQIGQFIKRKQAEEEVQHQNWILQAELNQAAEYVRSLFPRPLTGTVTTEALFIPSLQLGGDAFDYYWLDADHLAVYLLDVAGHGVRSALLSVSVLNVLRSQSLPNTNFSQPSAVLTALNRVFQMNENGDDYFTIWYGVYNRVKRELVYACAGHPPAILLSEASSTTSVKQLGSLSIPIGMLPEAEFDEDFCEIQPGNTLYLFSDGVYEIHQPDGNIWGLNAFIDLLHDYKKSNNDHLDTVLQHIQDLNGNKALDDDLSLLQINLG
ncbi:MAG: SpoIIE family protein phosphatase, partial [Cyanobacteriota bacterium]|nr:SpoIIE family protein phosphatase [Cyanobacteriota bacterium]